MGDRYMTTAQAAAYTTVNIQTMSNWRSAGTGPPYYKAGNRVVYLKSELDTWITGRTTEEEN